ncbi:MAG: hypothetical protein DSY55_03560 [Clostridia bacterium]|nr:MAG: hypothetical protein DSY55_03560 [Clostridia bacterium]
MNFVPSSTHLTVAIAADNADKALALARTLPPQVSLVEYRLDIMATVDIPLLAARTPVPAIFTCRPRSQGGHFSGPETERRAILREALATSHYVDIEMETLPHLANAIRIPGRVIGSHHNFSGMLHHWEDLAQRIRALGAGIVKLVGMATSERDALPPLAWLAQARYPAIAIAMGEPGLATRLLAPRFDHAFLTFAAAGRNTAPGQLNVHEFSELYGFARIARAAPLVVMLTPAPAPWQTIRAYRQALAASCGPDAWLLPLPTQTLSAELLRTLRLARVATLVRLPQVDITSDLRAYDIEPAGYAWHLADSSAPLLEPPTPRTLLTFLAQGA